MLKEVQWLLQMFLWGFLFVLSMTEQMNVSNQNRPGIQSLILCSCVAGSKHHMLPHEEASFFLFESPFFTILHVYEN